jgi:hypothetical protein
MARYSLEMEMRATKWLQAIRKAQEELDNIEMDEGIRKTIARCLDAEFSEAVERFDDMTMRENDGKKWTAEEDEIVRAYLAQKPIPPHWRVDHAEYYTQRRILAVELSSKVQRNEKSVEKRAVALGFRHFG